MAPLKLKTLAKFPALVLGETGISVVTENGSYTFALDLASLDIADGIPDALATYTVVFTPGATADDPVVYNRITFTDFLSLIIGGNPNLEALANNTDDGFWTHAGFARTLQAAAGLLWANPAGVAGDPSITLDINGLPADASPSAANDYVATFDASANAHKKVLITDIVASGSVGVGSFNARTGAVVGRASDYASLAGMGAKWNYGISASVAANALTVTLTDASGSTPSAASPSVANFRSATLATGTVTERSTTSAQSITAAAGATFGSANNTPFNLLVAEFDDAGTKRVGLMNASAAGVIYPVGATGRASSTAISSGSTSAGVWYTGTGVTNKPYVVIGRISWTATPLATAGTYANGPDVVEMAGDDFKMPGDVVQQKTTGDGTFKPGGTTLIPHDNSKPQITEGQEFYNCSISPTSQANWLVVRSRLYLSATAVSFVIAAVFQDANPDALGVAEEVDFNGNIMKRLEIEFTILANTVSSTTFRLRGGGNNAATFAANGAVGAGFFNGTLFSFISATEVQG